MFQDFYPAEVQGLVSDQIRLGQGKIMETSASLGALAGQRLAVFGFKFLHLPVCFHVPDKSIRYPGPPSNQRFLRGVLDTHWAAWKGGFVKP